MLEKLKANLKYSYAPYSKVNVSCILITDDNKEYTGVNVENASFGGTICAERVAILKAISEGNNKFKEIHIMSNLNDYTYPCFICRQTFLEFFNQDTKIFVYNNETKKQYSLNELCPYPFSKEDLKWKVDL